MNRTRARTFLPPSRAAGLVLIFVLALAGPLLLAACSGPPPQGREAELEQLRARVERLEQDSSAERARLAADTAALRHELRALRLSLDQATRSLGEAGHGAVGQGAAGQGSAGRGSVDQGDAGRSAPDAGDMPDDGQAAKSPRQALRETLRSMLEASRQALDRLGQALDRQLARPQRQTPL